MHVMLGENFLAQPERGTTAPQQAPRRLYRLLHHLSHLSGENDSGLALGDARLDEQDVAPDGGVVHAGGDADEVALGLGVQSLGLLDFQDALAGHPAYDLVSLLQDARRDVSPALEQAMLDRFAGAGNTAFRARYEVLGAQRNVKILGVFVRLRDRDARKGYVERLPRVWDYLDRNLAHPRLAPVKAWFDANVPMDLRKAWCR
jgi:hypothetical protein